MTPSAVRPRREGEKKGRKEEREKEREDHGRARAPTRWPRRAVYFRTCVSHAHTPFQSSWPWNAAIGRRDYALRPKSSWKLARGLRRSFAFSLFLSRSLYCPIFGRSRGAIHRDSASASIICLAHHLRITGINGRLRRDSCGCTRGIYVTATFRTLRARRNGKNISA